MKRLCYGFVASCCLVLAHGFTSSPKLTPSGDVASALALLSAFQHDYSPEYYKSNQSRRTLFQSTIGAIIAIPTVVHGAASNEQPGEVITIPLYYVPNLSAYVLKYRVGGEKYGAILDTGSPFLMVPGYCDESKWGCYRPESSKPSGLSSTYERFDNNEGEVEWRVAPFAFVGATGSMVGPQEMTFGVLSESLMNGPGGVFFGLVRDTDDKIRPSFLGQTSVRAFAVDLASEQKGLTLATKSLINAGGDYILLVKDLNRKYGDPTIHYTAKAKAIQANGRPVAADGKPIYVIFDTGVTGMVVTQELLNERYITARKNRERNLWGDVEVSFRTKQGKTVTINAKKPLTTPFGEQPPWPGFNGHLIVLGLSFLDGYKMTVDIDDQKLWID
jgi:hypothetical protein